MEKINVTVDSIEINGSDVSIKVQNPSDLITEAQANIDNANSNIQKWQAGIAQRLTDNETDTQCIADSQTYITTQQAIIDKVSPVVVEPSPEEQDQVQA